MCEIAMDGALELNGKVVDVVDALQARPLTRCHTDRHW
ncbi:hypothetical protein PC116_g5690 [Phytophthora cactorum]|uniref:Uncharacterized protein n=1 Tax=Phytophthora cactorum TaxID=29920 RepID=A0A8T1CYR7_9STRA|nr:hypothetical protein PC117_g13634 [Phytophthora cactorum]KAG3170198.1 hypothetical protein C6341_g10879 [Phytophthora cactorum]KAG4246553.1 hypothetical protein PC116_g5690 [Phytophthora cactorum]